MKPPQNEPLLQCESSRAERPFNCLNAARAILLSLGFVLHAAWLYRDRGAGYQLTFETIHWFRMEGFFLLAGFFAAMSLSKRTAGDFLVHRFQRIGIPWIFCYSVFSFAETISKGFVTWSPPEASALGHLWFLPVILAHDSLLCAVDRRFRRLALWLSAVRTNALVLVFGFGVMYLGFNHWANPFHAEAWHHPVLVNYLDNVVRYAPWSIAGYFFFHGRSYLTMLTSGVKLNILNVVLYLVLAAYVERYGLKRYVLQMWQGTAVLSCCGVVMWVSRWLSRFQAKAVHSLSAASYTMYLVHWPIMMLVWIPMSSSKSSLLLFSLLVTISCLVSYLIHFRIVQRDSVVAFLLNGSSDGVLWDCAEVLELLRSVGRRHSSPQLRPE